MSLRDRGGTQQHARLSSLLTLVMNGSDLSQYTWSSPANEVLVTIHDDGK